MFSALRPSPHIINGLRAYPTTLQEKLSTFVYHVEIIILPDNSKSQPQVYSVYRERSMSSEYSLNVDYYSIYCQSNLQPYFNGKFVNPVRDKHSTFSDQYQTMERI
jgi:hypothetical protein